MDALLLSRLQFAAATYFHFLFVPLTLGLSLLVAVMETKYVKTGDEDYLRMTRFWGKLFLVNFAVGVVTGITLEFQFGTNWAGYSEYVGDIFGSLLAIEATAAFFLESTFIAVWVFGWKKLSPKAHASVAWLIFLGSNLSAIWILLANGFMQNPVGYVLRNGRAELESFMAVITNSFGWQQFIHTIMGAWVLSAMFVMAVSSYHLLKKQHVEIFTRSFKMALVLGTVGALVVAVQGDFHAKEVSEVQPAKLAAMESIWETQQGAPMYLLLAPDEKNETNMVQALPIPGMLSYLAYGDTDATVKGLKDFPEDERPPVALTFYSFRIMVGLGTLFIGLMALGWIFRKKLTQTRWYLWVMLLALPLPYVANLAGWTVAEVGRQPWIVYGLMKTSDAVSKVQGGQVMFTLVVICALYAVLGLAGFYLMAHYVRKGPKPRQGA